MFLCSLQFHVEVGKDHESQKEIIVPVHDIQTDIQTYRQNCNVED